MSKFQRKVITGDERVYWFKTYTLATRFAERVSKVYEKGKANRTGKEGCTDLFFVIARISDEQIWSDLVAEDFLRRNPNGRIS